jgi:hypothetical protein
LATPDLPFVVDCFCALQFPRLLFVWFGFMLAPARLSAAVARPSKTDQKHVTVRTARGRSPRFSAFSGWHTVYQSMSHPRHPAARLSHPRCLRVSRFQIFPGVRAVGLRSDTQRCPAVVRISSSMRAKNRGPSGSFASAVVA